MITLAAASSLGAAASTALAFVCAGLVVLCAFFILPAGQKRRGDKNREKRRLPGGKGLAALFAPVMAALLTSALFFGLFAGAWETRIEPVQALNGREAQIRGTVLDYPEQAYHKSYYRVKVQRVVIGGKRQDLPEFTMRLSTQTPFSCGPYDGLECTVTFLAIDSSGGLYSTQNSRLADGTAISAYLSDYNDTAVIADASLPPGEIAARLRHRIGRSFEKCLPAKEAGLIRAMLLGEKDQVSDSAYTNFKRIGSTHLLVISGLHMAAVAAVLSLPLGVPFLGGKLQNLLLILGIFGFLFLVGFPVSAVRGGVMFLVFLVGKCLGRKPDAVNSLGFSVFVICLGNPFSGGDLGLALSALSTLGILLLAKRLSQALLRPLNSRPLARRLFLPAAGSLGVTFSAMLFTLPLQAAVFGGVSLMAPLASLILVLPCTALLYVSLPAAFLGLVPFLSCFAQPFYFCAGWLAKLSLWAAERLAQARGVFLPLSQPMWLAAAGGILALAVLACAFKQGRAVRAAALAGSFLITVCGCAFGPAASCDAVTFAAARDSSCVLVMQNGRAAVLALGGYRTDAASELLFQNNIRQVELLCLPVRDGAAREAAVRLLNTFGADKLALPENAYWGRDLLTAGRTAEHLRLQEGEEVDILEGVKVRADLAMNRMTVTFGASTVMVETAGGGSGTCQLLFTTQTDSKINSPFTVLQNDAIIQKEDLPGLLPGRYLKAAGDGLYADVFPDGTMRFRGAGTCLN